MIDHVLGRPSLAFRKTQVFAVVSFWSIYLLRGSKHGPPVIRMLSERLSPRITPWQTLVITLLWLYISRNFAKIAGLESPEPLANLYSRSYFRATWVTTALDAGFWTAMKIKSKWLRDIASMVFSIYYLFAAEQADEKVRKVRASLTVDHMRVSWNKQVSPYLGAVTRLLRPKFMRYQPRRLRIARPPASSYEEPIQAWLYFDGPLSSIKDHTNVILDVPGGGFVAMDPRVHDDELLAWAGKTGFPVLSLDYKKAPEYPYPYALNECFDAYHTLVASNGRCIGLSGETRPSVVIAGDSAGGNLAAGTVLMIIQSWGMGFARRQNGLPIPQGLILVYPALDMNIGSWMTDEQMSLIHDRRTRATNHNVLKRKSEEYYKLDPGTPHPSDDDDDALRTIISPDLEAFKTGKPTTALNEEAVESPVDMPQPKMAHISKTLTSPQDTGTVSERQSSVVASKPKIMKTRLAMSSMISYFSDRILTPEMMRAMIILYIGPHHRPDFTTDYLLSPLLAPESLLAEFPKTYFLTGERDPLVDDTVIFAGRIRQAKWNMHEQRVEMGLAAGRHARRWEERDHVEVSLMPGVSHGFFQFVSVFPEGWKSIFRCARWMQDLFAMDQPLPPTPHTARSPAHSGRHHFRRPTSDSSADEDQPLMMTPVNGAATDKNSRRSRRSQHERRDAAARRQQSSVSLASEDDLLQRRMYGFATSLMGEDDVGPKTP